MSELKTLNDLKERFGVRPKPQEGEEQDRFVSHLDLRQQAIMWIKEIRENADNPPTLLDKPEQTICWIKHFFNITEEDLKCKE